MRFRGLLVKCIGFWFIRGADGFLNTVVSPEVVVFVVVFETGPCRAGHLSISYGRENAFVVFYVAVIPPGFPELIVVVWKFIGFVGFK